MVLKFAKICQNINSLTPMIILDICKINVIIKKLMLNSMADFRF